MRNSGGAIYPVFSWNNCFVSIIEDDYSALVFHTRIHHQLIGLRIRWSPDQDAVPTFHKIWFRIRPWCFELWFSVFAIRTEYIIQKIRKDYVQKCLWGKCFLRKRMKKEKKMRKKLIETLTNIKTLLKSVPNASNMFEGFSNSNIIILKEVSICIFSNEGP